MTPELALVFGDNDLLVLLISLGVQLIVVGLLVFAIYHELAQPMLRQERTRTFLDLLHTGARQGRTYEQTIASLAALPNVSLGREFKNFAAAVQRGDPLLSALDQAPSFLPSRVVQMMRIGEETGARQAMLDALRRESGDWSSRALAGQSYAFTLLPVPLVSWALSGMLLIYVFPKFLYIAEEMTGSTPPGVVELVKASFTLASVLLIFWLVFLLVEYLFTTPFRRLAFVEPALAPVRAWISHQLPWWRNRMRRDVVATLAILLDAGLPEERALALAGQSAANPWFMKRVQESLTLLRAGTPLPEAVKALDSSGEYAWRLRNALAGGQRFLDALRGWLDTLEARAFQQEQVFAHTLTTGLVLLNGLMVAMITYGAFKILAFITQAALVV